MTRPTIAAALSLLLLTGCGGGAPKAAAPTPVPAATPAAPAPVLAPPAAALAPQAAAAAPEGDTNLTPFANAALAGASLIAEGKDGCFYLQQAAKMRHMATGAAGTAAGLGDRMATEALATHGPRCGVR